MNNKIIVIKINIKKSKVKNAKAIKLVLIKKILKN